MNRLGGETSPYLLQHKNNPVDWFPWGQEAFDEALRLDKPILLSIGYSSCHWCHVMAHESFENTETADLMNRLFVNIKVDREERPDVDNIYMNYVQLSTGSGGWPLTVFLTPRLVPFFGGTYFPPDDRYGRPGFGSLLARVSTAFSDHRSEIEAATDEVLSILENPEKLTLKNDGAASESAALNNTGTSLTAAGYQEKYQADFARFFSVLHGIYDSQYGGFGKAPKFPMPAYHLFLLGYYAASKNKSALRIVEHTLKEMACGGIYDQVGGGFHRYSTDRSWLIPHFEKMLYDNALLMRLYTDAFRTTKDRFYLDVACDIAEFVLREMTDTHSGGFYSSQDADSAGEEGKFYVYEFSELQTLLSEEELDYLKQHYGVSETGNFEGANILTRTGNSDAESWKFPDLLRQKLFNYRQQREKPGLDDKILTGWNALMMHSLSLLHAVTGKEEYLEAAVSNGLLLTEKLFDGTELYHTFKNGEVKVPGMLDDYAFLCEALITIYEVTAEEKWVSKAIAAADLMLEKFYDEEKNEFFFTPAGASDLIVRPVSFYDNVIPSGNSSALGVLLKLSLLTENMHYQNIAEKYISRYYEVIKENPLSYTYALTAIYFMVMGSTSVTAVNTGEDTRQDFRNWFFSDYHPFILIASKLRGTISTLPILEGRGTKDGTDAYYLCRNNECLQPVKNFTELKL